MNRSKIDKMKKIICLVLAFLMVAGVLVSTLMVPSYAATSGTSQRLPLALGSSSNSLDEERIYITKKEIKKANESDIAKEIKKGEKYNIELLVELITDDDIEENSVRAYAESGSFIISNAKAEYISNSQEAQLGGRIFKITINNAEYKGKGNGEKIVLKYDKTPDGKEKYIDINAVFDDYKFVEVKDGNSSIDPEKPVQAMITSRKITYHNDDREIRTSISRGRRYDIHINLELLGGIGESFYAAINNGCFKADYGKNVFESKGNYSQYEIILSDVIYTGKGNSINIKIWNSDFSYSGDFTITFDEYKFNEYKDSSGSDTTQLTSPTPGIYVKNYSISGFEGEKAKSGDTIILDVEFENSSKDFLLENIIMTLDTGSDFYLENDSNLYRKDFLDVGKTFKYTIELKVKNNIQPQAHTIKFDFKYQYINDNNTRADGNSSETIAIPLEAGENAGDDGKNPLVPHIIITQYDYGNKSVSAGETIPLSITCLNTSSQYDIENIVMKITPTDAFSLASSSNSFYIEKLPKNGAFGKTFDIQVKSDALPKSHDVNISFDFQYMAGETRLSGKSEETIAIPVVQIDRFSIQKVDMPIELWQGEEIPVSISLINKGKTMVSNVNIDFQTDDETIKETQYIGNVESGKEASGDFFITAKEKGQMNGKFIITYEDSNMNIKTLEKDFSVEVRGMDMEVNPGGFEPEFDPEEMKHQQEMMALAQKEMAKKKLTRNIILSICGVVIAGISAYVTISKIKVQRSEESDEDL